jgi:hypothetical protein
MAKEVLISRKAWAMKQGGKPHEQPGIFPAFGKSRSTGLFFTMHLLLTVFRRKTAGSFSGYKPYTAICNGTP